MRGKIEILDDMEKNGEWLDRNYEELMKKHPDTFIAIKNQRPEVCNKNLDELLKELQKKGIDRTEVLIEFIPSKDFVLLL